MLALTDHRSPSEPDQDRETKVPNSLATRIATNLRAKKSMRLVALFSFALLLRLFCIFFLETYNFRTEWAFGHEYGAMAKWVASGQGFSSPYFDYPRPSAQMAPVYVYFIAFIFSVFGIYSTASAIVIQVFQSIVSAGTCVVFYLLGEKLLGERVGLIAALILAIYPPAIFFSTMRIGPVALVVLLLGVIIYLLMHMREKENYRTTIYCGLLMGLAALTEPAVLPFFPLIAAWFLFCNHLSTATAAKHIFIAGCLAVLCVIPWTVRNYLVFHQLVLIKSPLGMNLLYGNNADGNGVISYAKTAFSPAELPTVEKLDEVTTDRLMSEKAMRFIRENPRLFFERTLRRFSAFWTLLSGYRETRFDLIRNFIYGSVLVLSCLGALLAYRNRKLTPLIPFLLFFFSYPLIFYVTHVTYYRYRYPVEPFLILFASYGLSELLRRTSLDVAINRTLGTLRERLEKA
jgi:4-amino-4-deoxy-L-arabinose transferase-like glycosyltransferase